MFDPSPPHSSHRKRSFDSDNAPASTSSNTNYSNNRNRYNNSNNNHNYNRGKRHRGGVNASSNGSRNQTTLELLADYVFGLPDLTNVALEFRVVPGISAQDFADLHRFIRKSAKQHTLTEYIYEPSRYLHSRLTADTATGMVTAGVYREKLAYFDMATNHDQDIQVNIMKSVPILPLPVCPEEGYVHERKKKKYTIETKDWSLDLLEVVTNGTAVTYDIEGQVKIASIRSVPDKKACVDLFDNVFVEMHNLLARLSLNGAQVFPDLKLERVIRHEHHDYLKTQFLQSVPNVNVNNNRFPGSLPQGLERNKIKYLQKGDYWVSEKSDGVRYLLIIVDRAAYLIDRKMEFYQIHKFPLLIELFGSSGVTLLDGEMVRNLRTGKLMFLIFDLLALNGQTNIASYKLSDRLALIGKKVVTVFRDAVRERGKEYASKLQFTLSGKIFRPKHLIKELVGMIKHNERGERLFVDDKRCHRNDGLIFTPSGPYLPYSSSHLMKWKYSDRLTIDFLFKFTAEGHQALVGKGGDVMIDWPAFDMAEADWDKLTNSLATTKDPSKAIIECAYNNKTLKWMFLTLRPDKDRPNHITTVQHTLHIVTENITLEEIVARIPVHTDDDDWEENHPELNKQDDEAADSDQDECEEGKEEETEESPTVDLPTSPLPSPIVAKVTPEPFESSP